MEQQAVSVGRVVHYIDPGDEERRCRAALITGTIMSPDGVLYVDLCVFKSLVMVFALAVTYGPAKEPGTWHWPERA